MVLHLFLRLVPFFVKMFDRKNFHREPNQRNFHFPKFPCSLTFFESQKIVFLSAALLPIAKKLSVSITSIQNKCPTEQLAVISITGTCEQTDGYSYLKRLYTNSSFSLHYATTGGFLNRNVLPETKRKL